MGNQRKKIAVSGNRRAYFYNKEIGKRGVWQILKKYSFDAIFGAGESPEGGVDEWVKEFCLRNSVPYVGFPPEEYTKKAYFERNLKMIKWADMVICIFAETIRYRGGTWFTLIRSVNMNKPVYPFLILTRHEEIYHLIPKLKRYSDRIYIKDFTIKRKEVII